MTSRSVHIPLTFSQPERSAYASGTWLVLLHARRLPPHAGLLIDGIYNSLTIKGHELNVSGEVLFKTIDRRSIETVFIRIVRQPVFSAAFQRDIFIELIKNEDKVKADGNTCLWPVKLFFREFYALPVIAEELLFDFIKRLSESKYLENFSACHLDSSGDLLELPAYTQEELREQINAQL